MSLRVLVLSALVASASSATIAEAPSTTAPPAARASGLASRKGPAVDADDDPPLLATLAQVHTGEHVPLDDATPTQARFSALLSDRSTGDTRDSSTSTSWASCVSWRRSTRARASSS